MNLGANLARTTMPSSMAQGGPTHLAFPSNSKALGLQAGMHGLLVRLLTLTWFTGAIP